MDRSTMENGFASQRQDGFPAGLRVLVVDDDPTWLKILEKMLKKCSYEVTTCCLARDALDILRGRKDGFDIVISDVNMPDMDGFKLLELVGLEMDLPVIMMSVDGETSRVMKGVQHGACDYLLKPVRMKELKNIWQHVFRKKIHEVKDIDCYESSEDILLRNGSHSKFDEGYLLSTGCDLSSGKKRKEIENLEYDDQEFSDTSSVKKARVVWSVDLHQKFVNAVNQIGLDKVGPKKILDLMNVPWLTRENVASHLQKYRLYLSRLQKPNDPTTSFCGIKQQDSTSKDQPASFSIQSSTPVHQKGAASSSFGYTTQVHQNNAASSSFGCTTQVHQNSAASSSFGYSNKNVVVQNVGSGNHEGDLMGIISFLPATESKNALHADLPDPQKASNRSPLGLSHSYGPVQLDANNISFGSPQKHPWDREIPMVQLIKQPKQELELEQYGYSHLPLPSPHQNFQAECLQPAPAINLKPSITECDKPGPSEIMGCAEYRSNRLKSPIEQIVDPFFVQAETATATPGDFVSTSTITGLPSVKSSSFNQNWTSIWESDERNLIAGSGPTLLPTQEDLPLNFLQDYGAIENVELNNLEFSDYHDPGLSAEVPSHLYDRLRFNFNSEFLCEPVTDHGLFIA